MKQYYWYAGQYVLAEELRDGFTAVEQADWDLVKDHGLVGITSGMNVTAQSTPDLTVQISAGYGHIANGRRIVIPSNIAAQDLSVDSSSVSTQVSTSGRQRIISIFAEPLRLNSDVRTDETSTDIEYQQAEHYKITIVQGTETISPAVDFPALDSGKLLLADCVRVFGQTTFQTADIVTDNRRQDVFNLNPGGASEIRRGNVVDALEDLQTYHNTYVTDVATASSTKGGALVGSDAYTPTPGAFSGLASGTVRSQLRELADGISGSTLATSITYNGSGNWADATAITAANVEAALDEVVSDLAGTAGGAKIGVTTPRSNFLGTSVEAQLADIDSKAAFTDAQNTFNADQTIGDGFDLLPEATTCKLGTATLRWGEVHAVAGFRSLLYGGAITTYSGAAVVTQWTTANGDTSNEEFRIVMPRAGEILSVSFQTSNPQTTGNNIIATVMKEGLASSVTVTYTGDNAHSGFQHVFSTPREYGDGTGTNVSFSAGDYIGVRFTNAGATNATTLYAWVEVAF